MELSWSFRLPLGPVGTGQARSDVATKEGTVWTERCSEAMGNQEGLHHEIHEGQGWTP